MRSQKMGNAPSCINLPSLFNQRINLTEECGPFHINTQLLFLHHLRFAVTGNALVIREIFSSGTRTYEVTQAMQLIHARTSLQGEPKCSVWGPLDIVFKVSDLNYHTNANAPSVISVLYAADLLNSASLRNHQGLGFFAR